MKLIDILKSNISEKEKESKISALFNFYPPKEEVQSNQGQFYQGLAQEALSTQFMDYYKVYERIEGDLIDYGSGYSKGTLLFESLAQKHCYSYEYLEQRVLYTSNLCERLKLDKSYIYKSDLLTSDIPIGDNYFIYLPLGDVFFRLIQKLVHLNHRAHFFIIESHGDFIDYIESLNKWFYLKEVIPSESNRHHSGIYHYEFIPQAINPNNILYQYILHYAQGFTFNVMKNDSKIKVNLKETLPIKYNNKMAIESFALKRIIDNKIILFENPHLTIGE